MVRRRMRSDAPLFSDSDYDFIMQRRNEKLRHKVLKDLTEKYGTSTKRIYQIWRGEEADRVTWDQPLDIVLRQTSDVELYTEVKQGGAITQPIRIPSPVIPLKKTDQKKRVVIEDSATIDTRPFRDSLLKIFLLK
jgi:hypothetical protein